MSRGRRKYSYLTPVSILLATSIDTLFAIETVEKFLQEKSLLFNNICQQNPCFQEGSIACQPINSGSDRNCHCIPGWIGDNCNIKIGVPDDVIDGLDFEYQCTEKEAADNCQEYSVCKKGISGFRPDEVQCQCLQGFEVSGEDDSICKDIDECNDPQNPFICQSHNSVCTNLPGSYSCGCEIGYRMDLLTDTCIDIDECNSPYSSALCRHIPGSTCKNLPGSFECQCKPGYELNPKTNKCQQKNECLQNPCGSYGSCVDSKGSYKCVCFKKYEFVDGTCKRIDPCRVTDYREDPCIKKFGEGAKCRSNPRRSIKHHKCYCKQGYTYDRKSKTCKDKNECEILHMLHKNDDTKSCVNLPGTFSFECNPGWQKSPDQWVAANGRGLFKCIDVDECKDNPDICPTEKKCVNTEGSYKCVCQDGYFENSQGNCQVDCEVFEQGRLCENNDCSNDCDTASGKYYVECNRCVDVDECKPTEQRVLTSVRSRTKGLRKKYITKLVPSSVCDNSHSDCVNTDGSFSCECHQGFQSDPNDATDCIDIDECQLAVSHNSTGICPIFTSCVNTIGSYNCQCNDGFTTDENDPTICHDIDECSSEENPNQGCEQICINTPGSFHCECNPGWSINPDDPNGKDCVPGDPCLEMTCDHMPNSICLKGQCVCPAGFKHLEMILHNTDRDESTDDKMTLESCMDIDECELAPLRHLALCDDQNSDCVNTVGAYICQCRDGYETIPGSFDLQCKDVDECVTEDNVCSENAICVNFIGSYGCQCQSGFEFDPLLTNKTLLMESDGARDLICHDIDECLFDADEYPCPENAVCINKAGSFSCECDPGFVMNDEKLCVNINECEQSPCQQICTDNIGSYKCSCFAGFQVDPEDDSKCLDIDECSDDSLNSCQFNENCVNASPFYDCQCDEGFRFTEEIAKMTETLETDTLALNMTKHQFWSSAKQRCENINECEETPDLCTERNQACYDTVGSYKCDCKEGFRVFYMTNTCEDINECTETPNICGPEATCQNKIGGYHCTGCYPTCDQSYSHCVRNIESCQCNEGWKSTGLEKNIFGNENQICEDIDECQLGTYSCHDTQVCENTQGSYKCVCPPGFKPSEADPENKCEITECPTGYKRKANYEEINDLQCYDINECLDETTGNPSFACSDIENAICINTPGSFKCECKFGSVLETRKVPKNNFRRRKRTSDNENNYEEDYDPETEIYDSYDENDDSDYNEEDLAYIQGNNGGIVDPYYQNAQSANPDLDSIALEFIEIQVCVDFDECEADKFDCHETEVCRNTLVTETNPRGYSCDCPDGWIPQILNDTETLSSADGETEETKLLIDHFCLQVNCSSGYFKLGTLCMDIDECQLTWEDGKSACGKNAICQNTDGDYTCSCPPGYKFDFSKYSDPNDITPSNVKNHEAPCVDINECREKSHDCDAENFEKCKNTLGSFECACKNGFERDEENSVCQDIDECHGITGSNKCHNETAVCVNNIGGYECQCNEGYQFENPEDQFSACVDIDECAMASSKNETICADTSQICKNTPGSFECICPSGFDSNPKFNSNSSNSQPACLPTSCDPGQEKNINTGLCQDIDECLIKCNGPHHICENQSPGYNCDCKLGFAFNQTNEECLDIDECEDENSCTCLGNREFGFYSFLIIFY